MLSMELIHTITYYSELADHVLTYRDITESLSSESSLEEAYSEEVSDSVSS